MTSKVTTNIKNKLFKCERCEVSFGSNYKLGRHYKSWNHKQGKAIIRGGPTECNICEICFDKPNQLRRHMKGKTIIRLHDAILAKTAVKCLVCDTWCLHSKARTTHTSKSHHHYNQWKKKTVRCNSKITYKKRRKEALRKYALKKNQ
jgi:hypothetical protein